MKKSNGMIMRDAFRAAAKGKKVKISKNDRVADIQVAGMMIATMFGHPKRNKK